VQVEAKAKAGDVCRRSRGQSSRTRRVVVCDELARLPGLLGGRAARDGGALRRPTAMRRRRHRRRAAHAQSVPHRRHVVPPGVLRLRHRSALHPATPANTIMLS